MDVSEEPKTQTQYGGIGGQPPGKIPPTKYAATAAPDPEPPKKGKSGEGAETLLERIEEALSTSQAKRKPGFLVKNFNYALEKLKLKKPDIPYKF